MKVKILGKITFLLTAAAAASLIALAGCSFGGAENAHKHSYEWTTVNDATCTEDGLAEGKCGCGDITTKILPQKGHAYKFVEDPPASCMQDGKRMQKCMRCGAAKDIVTLPKTGHKWNDGTILYDADCQNPGRKLCECEYCSAKQEFEIAAKGHIIDENFWDIDKEPTFFEDGLKSHHCKREGCQYKTGETKIDSLHYARPEVTYNIKLLKTNGESFPLTSAPKITVKDKDGLQKGETDACEYTITLPSNQIFYVEISGLPEGYTPQESYPLLPEDRDVNVNIKIPAAPIEFKTETHGRYAIGSVIIDDPFTVVEESSANDYETSLGALLQQYKGIFINMYFNSCPACNYELADFISAYNSVSAYGEKYSEEIAVVLINVTDSTDAIRAKKITEHIPMMMAAHNAWFSAHFVNISKAVYPTSIWIDCEGVIVGSKTSALGKYSFTGYFDLLLDRYYKIKGTERPNKTEQNIVKTACPALLPEKRKYE